MIDPEFDLQSLLTGVKSNIVNPDQEESMVSELVVFLIIGGVTVITLVGLFIIGKYFKSKVKEKFMKIKQELFFNGIVRSISISYFQICLSIGIQLRMAVSDSKYTKPTE